MKNKKKRRDLVVENVGLGVRTENLEKKIKIKNELIKKYEEYKLVSEKIKEREKVKREIEDNLNYLKVSHARVEAEIEALKMELK